MAAKTGGLLKEEVKNRGLRIADCGLIPRPGLLGKRQPYPQRAEEESASGNPQCTARQRNLPFALA
jgi:hypothetical protein